MKKKKIKLRERIKNRPKSHSHAKTRKKTQPETSLTHSLKRPAAETAAEGMQVMSQVVLDFAKPLLDTCPDEVSERKAISLAIFVWNAALLSPQEQQQTLGEYLSDCRRTLPAEEVKILSGCIDRLVETKRTRFAHDRRKITNCTFGDFANHRHLEVGYTLE